jgi:hypothetical protein
MKMAFLVLLSLGVIPGYLPVRAQLSTADRVAEDGFWPTKSNPSREEFTGSAACAHCHSAKVIAQKTTPMAQTLARAEQADVLQLHHGLIFQNGKYIYKLGMMDGKAQLTVTDGTRTLTDQLAWAFGNSSVGQTYLFLRGGDYFEARVSYFGSLNNLHFTPSRALLAPKDLEQARSRPVSPSEVKRCFSCHSTGAVFNDQFDAEKLTPGVSCEACHGPGAMHASAMQASLLQQGVADDHARSLIFDPGKLSPVDSVDFCGACHATWWDVKLTGITGVSNVRSQPYRLQNSKCWGKGDPRITCIACHDPHVPLARESSAYDQKCLACHAIEPHTEPTAQLPGAACPVARKNCSSCHMPKIDVPEMHYAFADHNIRIVKPNAPYPN